MLRATISNNRACAIPVSPNRSMSQIWLIQIDFQAKIGNSVDNVTAMVTLGLSSLDMSKGMMSPD